MSNKPNNPSAFPSPGHPGVFPPDWGMTLRDWMAGQAASGMIASSANPNSADCPVPVEVAHYSYAVADAMLKEREK